jgi:hypothetical protein
VAGRAAPDDENVAGYGYPWHDPSAAGGTDFR